MDAAAPELRLAGGALELVAAVCRLRQGDKVVEAAGDRWSTEDGGLVCDAGPLRIRVGLRWGRRRLDLRLTARAAAAAEVLAIGLSFRPAIAGGFPNWVVYDGYQSWDSAGILPWDAAPTSWWRCGLADSAGSGVALTALSAARHATRFDLGPDEVRWLQVAPPAGGGDQPVWRTATTPNFEAEPLRLAAGPDVRELLAASLPKLARTSGAPPRGWLSWYHLGIWVDAAAVLANSALLAEGAAGDLRPAVVQIDDGWQIAYGDWRPNTKFPDLASLCAELGRRRQVPGIWTAPFLVSAGADLAGTAPEAWFLRDPASGERLVDQQHTVFGPMYVLDPREAGVRRHLTAVFRELRQLGFRYFKIDFLYAGAYSGLPAFRQALQAIRRGTGTDAYLLACGAPALPVAGLVDGCRIGPDTCTPWPDLTTGEPQPTFFGDEVRNVIRNVAAHADLARWFQTDPDVAVAGGTLSLGRARQLLTAVALCGGLYFVSDDLRVLDPERLALVANPALAAIAAGGPARPDWEPEAGDLPPRTWRRVQDLVAVFNFGRNRFEHRIDVPGGRLAHDVWSGEQLRARQGAVKVSVGPDDVCLIRFDPS